MSEKKSTPLQTLIEKLKEMKSSALNQSELSRINNEDSSGVDALYVAYSIAIKQAESLLPLERQEFIDCYQTAQLELLEIVDEAIKEIAPNYKPLDKNIISNDIEDAEEWFTNTFKEQ